MIYILFLYHDRAVLYSNMRNGIIGVAEGTLEYSDDNEWKEDMQKGLWLFKVTEGDRPKGMIYLKSYVKAEAELDIPVITYFMSEAQAIEFKDNYLKLKPTTMIRTKKALKAD